jgi:hypothetical protein
VYDGYTVKFIIEPSDAQGGGDFDEGANILSDYQQNAPIVINMNPGFGPGSRQVNNFRIDRSSALTFKNLGNPDFISVTDMADGTLIFSNSRAGESAIFNFRTYLNRVNKDNANVSITVTGGDRTPTYFQYILWGATEIFRPAPPKFR